MANDLDVLTLGEAKDALLLSGTNAFDTKLPGWITAVSARLDKLIGPVVIRTITDELHDGGRESIWLEFYPVTSITSVTEYDGTVATTLTRQTVGTEPAEGYLTRQYKPDRTLLSGQLRRRMSGARAKFATGEENVEVTYEAGRFADTASVGADYKRAAGLMLQNLWRSQQDGTGSVGEFDVPQSIFPTFAVPKAVREMFPGELQEPRMRVR